MIIGKIPGLGGWKFVRISIKFLNRDKNFRIYFKNLLIS